MQVLNDPLPWWGMMQGAPLSIVDLIDNGTVPTHAAAALWWALERGASAFVAAGPRLAGKSTLATALCGFLPEGTRAYVTAGPGDPLAVPAGAAPTYLLINELSNHTPRYLAGPAARRAFALLRRGHRVIGTLHADSAAEAVEVMHHEAGIPLTDIAQVTLVIVLRARRTETGVERRVVEIGLLTPDDGRVRVTGVAAWDPRAGQLALLPLPGGAAALAAWAGVPAAQAERETAARAAFLAELARGGVRAPGDVEAAIRQFRREGSAGRAPV